MKKIFFIILFFTFFSLLGYSKSKPKDSAIKIEVINKTISDLVLDYFKILGPSVVAVISLYFSYSTIKSRLVEKYITDEVSNINSANQEVFIESQKLILKYKKISHHHKKLKSQDLINSKNDIELLFTLSLKASSDVSTLIFFLITTLDKVILDYDKENDRREPLYANNYSYFLISILQKVSHYATQVVPIPKSTKTHQTSIINKQIAQTLPHSTTTSLRYFKRGVIYNPDSAHYAMFFESLTSIHNILIIKSGFTIFNNPKPISYLLFLNGFYAPPILEEEPLLESQHIHSNKRKTIHLIHFKERVVFLGNSGKPFNIVELTYTNTDNVYRFIKNLDLSKLRDKWIPNSTFEIRKNTECKIKEYESIKISCEKTFLINLHKHNISSIKKKLGLGIMGHFKSIK
ncbi:hypothetical protein V6R21_19870 [Limibacter armeniacum]|uniref:hypothetical protein n=1 Tax=Limibacter armeniacum TaxID=466084 RepID=UPI002FE5D08D